MEQNFEVSVVIPTYNAADLIGYQLKSLSEQLNAPRFEVVVSDNGSTDDLFEVVAHFSDRLSVRIVDASMKQGVGYARNIGVIKSKSENIIVCDADDVVSRNWVREMARHLIKEDCLVTSSLFAFYEDEEIDFSVDAPEGRSTQPGIGLGFREFASGCSFGVRKSTYLTVGGTDESYTGGSDDIDFSWRVMDAGVNLRFAKDATVYYRQRSGNKAIYTQIYRYSRENVLLWRRRMEIGEIIDSVSYKAGLIRVLETPAILVRNWNNQAEIGGIGGRVGAFIGNIKYRILKQKKERELIEDYSKVLPAA